MKLTTSTKLKEVCLPEIKDELLQKAAQAINKREVYITSFSGKIASGKDTFADSFIKNYEEIEKGKIAKTAFADHLKGELTSIITYFESHFKHQYKSYNEMIHDFSVMNNIPIPESQELYRILEPAFAKKRKFNTRGNSALSGWSRTLEVRKAKQYLGTEIRQNQDQIYWVRRVVQHVIANAGNGISTVISDVRFLHEIKALELIGSYNIRINISPEVQQERIRSRDNLLLTPESLTHRSETELDNYRNFNQQIDNNKPNLAENLSSAYTKWISDRDEIFNG